MRNNIFIKLLCSIPIILLMLYFIPFLGICLILFRLFVYSDKKKISTPLIILITGILCLLPKGISLLTNVMNVELTKIPYLNDILNSDYYNVKILEYSKLLITVGIIFIIITYVFNMIFSKVSSKLNSGIRNYINETQIRDAEISRKNDMEIKIKQEKAKNTSYVECPNCGSDNLLSEKHGTCKYCRSKLVNKNYKE